MPQLRPAQIYDFTAFSRRAPTQQQPGDRLDAQFKAHADAIVGLQLAVEKLKPLTPEVDVKALAAQLKAFAAAEFGDLRQQALNTRAIVSQAQFELARAKADADRARDAADRAEARLAAAVEKVQTSAPTALAATPPNTPLEGPQLLGPNTGGFYAADVMGATATSADYAQVSIEWAEHLPDTIPPNILAINAISGQHWSSRWWAMKSASAFGMLAWQYLGPWPSSNAPSQTPTGDPLAPGMMYFDTTKNVMMVWNGSAWQPMGQPQPGITSSLYYLTTANQTVFPLTGNDLFGRNTTLQTGQGVAMWLNGVRLTPDDGSGTKGDFTVNVAASTITLVKPAPAGVVAAFDALALPSQLAPSVAKVRKLKPLVPVFDGATTVFTIQNADGSTPNVTDPVQLFLSLDGVEQEPVGAFTASGATLTFTVAPAADAYFFGVWLTPT